MLASVRIHNTNQRHRILTVEIQLRRALLSTAIAVELTLM